MTDSTTPGPEGTSAGTSEAPPPVAATNTPPPQDANQPPQPQEVQQTLEPLPATPEEFQRRLVAERDKTLNEYRAKAGREAGWMGDPRAQSLSDDDKQFILGGGLSALRAKVDAYERSIAAFPQKEAPKVEGPDPLEQDAAELIRLAKDDQITPEAFYKGMAQVQRKIARREAEDVQRTQFRPSFEAMTVAQQRVAVSQDPRMKDVGFMTHYHGVMIRESQRRQGNFPQPLEALELTAKELNRPLPQNGNGHTEVVPPVPAVTPSFGEPRTIQGTTPQPSLTLAERFARTASGRRLDGK